MVDKSLSHYKILSELGRGGMGIVYKAEDTKLDRTVAIKVLPSAALASEDDRARFYREAKAAAQLHHPHIASVFEIDEAVPSDAPHGTQASPFIAMEFIDGETLQERVKQGPLKLEEAVRIASEIASALEAAHEKDIVHRDIKSANVMLTAKGVAKVLDFGLAQTAASTKLTKMGSTVGTVAYMSPEQARGEDVDLRTDLWSLGAVLYEMIAGRMPFPGDYEQAVLFEILNQDPEPLTAIRTGIPMGLEWIVAKCLAKEAQDRYQTATDLLVDLRTVDLSSSGMSRLSGTISGVPAATAAPTTGLGTSKESIFEASKTAWPVIVATFVATFVVAIGLGYLAFSGGVPQSSPTRLEKLPIHLDGYTNVKDVGVSATSEYLTFTATDTLGNPGIFLFHTQTAATSRIMNSEEGNQPRFSPDGKLLAFSKARTAYVVTVPTGVPRALVPRALVLGWSSPTSVLYFSMDAGGTMRIDVNTDFITTVAVPDTSSGDPYEYWIYGVIPHTGLGVGNQERRGGTDPSLVTVDLDSGKKEVGEEGIINPHYVQGGFLVYQLIGNNGPFKVRPFDAESREFRGPPEDLLTNSNFRNQSVGADGSYLYVPAAPGQIETSYNLFFYDLSSSTTEKAKLTGNGVPRQPAYSPDGLSVALDLESEGAPAFVSEYNMETGVFRPRTLGDLDRRAPAWSADGTFLYHFELSSESLGIYKKARDNSGPESLVVEGDASDPDLSADNRWLAFDRDTDIWLSDLQSGVETVLDSTKGFQYDPVFSPDSKYVAFGSRASGRARVVVRSVSGSDPFILSHLGAREPVWALDGKSLYYVVVGEGIYRVAVTTDPFFDVVGQPQQVVGLRSAAGAVWFDISPDGNTLAITATSIDAGMQGEQKNYSTIMWWRNWAQSLKDD